MLSVNPKLRREEVKEVLQRSAEKIGSGYDANGHSNDFGFGRVDARAAGSSHGGGRPDAARATTLDSPHVFAQRRRCERHLEARLCVPRDD